MTWIYASGAAFLWMVAVPIGQWAPPASGAGWLAVAGMALVSQLIGHTSLNWALRYFSAGQVTAATLLEPVFASIFAWFLLSEMLSGWQIIGGVILLAGVALSLAKATPTKVDG